MANERECGGCTACCKTHGVSELSKSPGVWCEHCDIFAKGCRIYSDRPKSCREFKCAWLKGFGLEEYRPDKTGIVVTHKRIPSLDIAVWLHEAEDGAIDSDYARKQLRHNLEIGNSVLTIPLNETPTLYVLRGKKRPINSFRLGEREVEIILCELEW